MILTPHIPILAEILNLDGFLADPVLSFGYQDVVWHENLSDHIAGKRSRKEDTSIYMKLREQLSALTSNEHFEIEIPWQFMEKSFNAILANYGIEEIWTLDLFDRRADFTHDMNLPLPDNLRNRFNTVIDIGSTEHVFDTRQCLENLFGMLRQGGRIMMHTPCSGYSDHGFYTFNPETIVEALRANGFKIEFLTFSLEPEGIKMDKPVTWNDTILWCAAKKVRQENRFVIPQQKGCQEMYGLLPHAG